MTRLAIGSLYSVSLLLETAAGLDLALAFPFVAAFMYLLHGVLDIYLRDPFLKSIGVMG